MRSRSSKWWWGAWVAALGVGIFAWRASHTTSDPAAGEVDVTVHVKLAPSARGAGPGSGGAPVGEARIVDAEPLFEGSAAELAEERNAAARASGVQPTELPDLTAWRRVRLRVRDSRSAVDAAIASLRAGPDVEAAFESPRPEVPFVPTPSAASGSCPIQTPRYDDRQGYLRAAPGGIDALAAWKQRGGRGEAVWFADVEGGWNAKHEDLPGDRIQAIGPSIPGRDWEMHGTAVLGEVVSRDNKLGMVGIAPDVKRVVTSSIAKASTAAAIDRAQKALRPGDVLLIELHAIGPRRRYLPMEYWQDVFDVIKIATARGVVVIEAAGNGAEDLDHEAYERRFDRAHRDSGAIMVGAGAPAVKGWTDRSRLDFSNYGARVDVQGWGRMVASLDYGDLQGCDVTRRKYTNLFGGTSSASPIVAGAALLLQSIRKTEKGCILPPKDLRKVLVETGSPQTDGPHGDRREHIGPRPDLSEALARLRTIECERSGVED